MAACAGQDVTILYYTTLEPFDAITLASNCNSDKILVCEPQFSGTMLYDIHTALPGRALQIEHVGFPRTIFRNYGTYDEKMQYYQLTKEAIAEKLKKLLSA